MADQKLKVTCPSCGTTLAFRPEQAGGRFRCPKCKNPVQLAAPEEEAPAPPPRPPTRAPAPSRPPMSSRGSAPARRSPPPPPEPPAEEEPPAEQEEAAPAAPPRSVRGRGRGRAAVPAGPVSKPGIPAGNKKLLLIGIVALVVLGGGGLGAFFAFGPKGKPETAGKSIEGREVWKLVGEDLKAGETKPEAASRATALNDALAKIEAARKDHDYGWPDYFKGRALDRLGKRDEAKAAFDAAQAKLDKSAHAYVMLERGLSTVRRAHDLRLRTRRFRAGGPSFMPEPEAAAADQAALPDLRAAASGPKEQDFCPGGLIALAEGEANRIEGQSSGALRKFELAAGAKAYPEVSGALMGGEYAEMGKWDLAVKTLDAAVADSGGAAFARLTRAWVLRKRYRARPEDGEAAAWLDKALEDVNEAAKAGHAVAPLAVAAVQVDRAELAIARGQGGAEALAAAEVAVGAAQKDGDWVAQELAAALALRRADMDEREGKDPRASLDGALGAFDQAVSGSKDDPVAVLNRGRALLRRARTEAARGGDARPIYDRASADFAAVAGKDASRDGMEPTLSGAVARVEKAVEDSKKGVDATATFAQAVEDMTALLKKFPGEAGAREARGRALWAMGDAEVRAGKDGGPTLDKALEDLDEVARARPGDAATLDTLIAAWMARGEAYSKAGADAGPAYQGAVAALDQACTKSPGNMRLLLMRGKARRLLGDAKLANDLSGEALTRFQEAVTDLSEVVKADAGSFAAIYERGQALYGSARAEAAKNQDPRVTLNLAVRDFEAAMAKDDKKVEVIVAHGEAVLWMAAVENGRGQDAYGTLERARISFDKACAADANTPLAWCGVGRTYLLEAQFVKSKGGDISGVLAKAEPAIKKGLELGARRAHMDWAFWLALSQRYDEADKEFVVALEKAPELRKDIEGRKRLMEQWRRGG
ncbi:MAG: hypothetical protein HYY18_05245 [Planctomycetes bacterium]|nr:hypothetical protein [Planctomycetota bacterium]